MVTIAQQTVWTCRRDYWRLDVFETGTEDDGRLASLCGRRQNNDPFWAPVVMDVGALARFGASLLSAATVVAGFQVGGVSDCRNPVPTRLFLAKCCGAFYELEIHGVVRAGTLESAELLAVLPAAHRRPVVWMGDNDLELFCADIATALAAMDH